MAVGTMAIVPPDHGRIAIRPYKADIYIACIREMVVGLEVIINMFSNSITKITGTKYPIIQGGMARIADASLAAAVSNAGGLGLISCGGFDQDYVRNEIRKAKSLTDNPFGINIMLMDPNAADFAQLAIDEGVRFITTGAGSPSPYMSAWKAAGITVMPVAGAVAWAKRMERAGADAIIAEGCEAGGHIGEVGTMPLVPQVADSVSVPVIAAGGIADGRGLAAAFMLGAAGVQCGTVFLCAEECCVRGNYKNMILKATETSTMVTGRSHGHPVRALKNKMMRAYQDAEQKGASFEELEKFTLGSLRRAVLEDDVDAGSFMAGQSAGLVSAVRPAKEIIEGLFADAARLLENAGSIVR